MITNSLQPNEHHVSILRKAKSDTKVPSLPTKDNDARVDDGERDRVERIVEEKRVKLQRFLPSGREIWTVVGSRGDHLVMKNQPYCTCGHFHFWVLGGDARSCYHLDAVKEAQRRGKVDLIEMDDSEYGTFIYLLTKSIPLDSSRA